MATKKAVKRPAPVKHLLHEVNADGQHRIVILTDGVPDNSAWFERRQVAHYKGLFASASWDSKLPHGIFRVSVQTFKVLAPKRVELVVSPTEKSDDLGGMNG